MNWLARVWSALSQLGNVIIFNGHPNESISGRSYREPWPRRMKFINRLFFWQNHHCRGAHNADVTWAKDFAAKHDK